MKNGYLRNNPEIIDELIKCLEDGVPIIYAGDYVGISEPTYYSYINKANDDIQAGKKNSIYIKFLKRVKKARSTFIQNNMKNIQTSANKGNWQSSAWLLERLDPETFALKKDFDNKHEENIEIVNDIPNSTK